MAKSTKLTKKELEHLHVSLSELRNTEATMIQAAGLLVEAQVNLASINAAHKAAGAVITTIKEEYVEKYGQVDINVQTGEFKSPDEE